MKKEYVKPEIKIVSYKNESNIMLVSGVGSQTKFSKKNYSDLNF